MNIERKLELARQQVASIASHDDVPEAEVKGALLWLAKLVKEAADTLRARRATRAKSRAG